MFRNNISDNLIGTSKVKNFFISKRNYLILISLSIIFVSIIVIIIIATSSSNSSNKNSDSSNENSDSSNENSDSSNENSNHTLTPWEKYIKAEKYLYIWEYYTPDYILKLCQDHHFTRVYLSIGCIETFWDDYYSKGEFPAEWEIGALDYETFIKKLNDINVEVELVTFLGENPNNFDDINRVTKVANMVKNLSKKVKIKALHFDQEPGDEESYENLLKMYIKVNEIFPASAILRPFWLNLKMKNLKSYFNDMNFFSNFEDCETLVDAIMKVTKYTDLMAYNEDYSVVTSYMEKLKTIASRHPDNEAKNVIEISGEKDVPNEDSLHQRYLEDNDKFFNFIYDSSLNYGGITIHYYETWYKTLYCVWPQTKYPYDGGKPKTCCLKPC
jgi:hypothetical protein